jgi:hypothetical protein
MVRYREDEERGTLDCEERREAGGLTDGVV